jgi:DNA polymerase V
MDDIKLTFHKTSTETELAIPLAQSSVKAGFPSPAQDYMSEEIDLNRLLIPHPEATFFVRISGDSMMDAGILDGDLAVVDKSLDASDSDFVIAFVDGDFTIKQFRLDASGNSGWLVPWNKRYPRIEVKSGEDFRIWGVVTYVIHAIHGLKTKYHVRNNP